jgi:hypothetical protein
MHAEATTATGGTVNVFSLLSLQCYTLRGSGSMMPVLLVYKHARLLNQHTARHSITLQCMRLPDQVTLNFNKKTSTAAGFLHIEKAFNTTWQSGMIYKII